MNENLTIEIERLDDLPVLMAQSERMGLVPLIDQHFPTHGNWHGQSIGWVVVIWLCHILCTANHRLNHVRPWVADRLRTLTLHLQKALVEGELSELDFTDDRLASVLDYLSNDEAWEAFEVALGQRLIRVYQLKPGTVRLDSTAASGYAKITPDGLFQFGHSKDHRPDLPQIKVQLSVLDPLGLPLSSTIVSGERADDGLYVPEIKKVQQILEQKGLLYVGDCKMGSVSIRAYVSKSGDYYLCPLSQIQCSQEELNQMLEAVWSGSQEVTKLYGEDEKGQPQEIAVGFEIKRSQSVGSGPEQYEWEERLLVIRSLKLAEVGERRLQARLNRALDDLKGLNERKRGKVRLETVSDFEQAAAKIVKRYEVEGLIGLTYLEKVTVRNRRKHKERPADVVEEREVSVEVCLKEDEIDQAKRVLGWRVYATNHPVESLGLNEAVLAYRNEYLVERNFGRLKGRGLSLQPMYLAKDDRVKGLLRLLMLCLRMLTLLEYEVRRKLSEVGEKLSGLYAGQPNRTTARPTAEKLLEAFKVINLSKIEVGGHTYYHVTPLSALQSRILELLGFSTTIFTDLSLASFKLPYKMSEP
jgi:transposase